MPGVKSKISLLGEDGLTPKQEKFCYEYIVNLNGAQAARKAGYKGPNYSALAAGLMQNKKIRTKIRKLLLKKSKKTKITAEYVLNILDTEIQRVIADPEHKPQDLYKGVELLGRHLAMWTDKVQIDHQNDATSKLAEIADRILQALPRPEVQALPAAKPLEIVVEAEPEKKTA